MRITSALILAIFILSGCGQHAPVPCVPKKCEFPKLPTYRVPASRSISVKPIDVNRSVIANSDLIELVKNNEKLRRICSRYAVINKRVNKEYQE